MSWRWLATLVVVLSGRRGGDDVGDGGGGCGRHGGVGGVVGVCVLFVCLAVVRSSPLWWWSSL